MANSTTAGKSSARGQQLESSRPAKRRRVEDKKSSGARQPVKLHVSQPHGALNRTLNGVRTQVSVDENDLDERSRTLPESQHSIATADATQCSDQKRILRSQGGGPRLSSDLSHFFQDYEETIFGEAKAPDILKLNSSLYVTDDKASSSNLPIRSAPSSKVKLQSLSQPNTKPSSGAQSSSSAQIADSSLNNDALPDLSAYEKEALDFHADPLPDSEYLKAHRRGERNEKQMRNVEKERAMHEKWELERLYEELRGPDWLKTMGISGVTDTEKKKFESKRDHYVGRVKALLAKFEKWRDNEKELKMKRERLVAARADDEEEDEGEEEEDDEEGDEDDEDEDEDQEELYGGNKDHRQEDAGDELAEDTAVIDASALQLQQEAESAGLLLPKSKVKAYDPVLELWDAAKPFTSFYKKPHERAGAVGNHRRGRHVSAFGHPLPHMADEDFDLPEGFLTSGDMRDNARKRRREKRHSLATEEKST